MRKSLFAIAAVSTIATLSVTAAGLYSFTRAATPSPHVTFPSLSTIYVGSGVTDSGSAANAGVATAVHCSNVSGVTAGMRFVVHSPSGAVEADVTLPIGLPHGVTITLATHGIGYFTEVDLGTGIVNQGMLNIESTQSGVFCTAMIVDAAAVGGVALDLVRANPHPGAVQ
jgi:hypothetical protein